MLAEALLIFIMILPLAGSFAGYIIGMKNEKVRDIFNIITTGITFLAVMLLYKYVKASDVEILIPNIMGVGLHLKVNTFRYIFIWLTSFIWFLTTVYSTEYFKKYKNRNRFYLFFMLTLWSTLGVFVSENILNLFTFFEIMSLTSYVLIIHDESEEAHEAGNTYIVMTIAGGLILLMGIFLLYDYTKTLDIMELRKVTFGIGNVKYFISALIIIGFGVKAGMVPLHIWLPKAHPAAPAPASAVLSGILLKTGIYGIIVTTDMMGNDFITAAIILGLGFFNMFIGGLLAMLQRNIKRILAYSSMSQIGYILVGIGLIGILKESKAIAIYGTIYHIINHGIFKVLLFMAAGAIYMVLHEISINKVGGFGKGENILKLLFFIGLCGITGVPGFNGFASKNLLHEALTEAHHIYGGSIFAVAEIIFIISSSFTVAYLLKIFIAVFVEKGANEFKHVKGKVSLNLIMPMFILAASVVYIGMQPHKVINVINGAMKTFYVEPIDGIHFYSFNNLKSSTITLILGILIYVLFVRRYLKKGTKENYHYINPSIQWFNLENDFYKPVLKTVLNFSLIILSAIDEGITKLVVYIAYVFKCIGRVKISYVGPRQVLKNTVAYKVKNKDFIQKNSKGCYSLKDELSKIHYMLNSVTYSIFIFGIVLVVCLIILIKF